MFAFFLTGVLGGFGGALFVMLNIRCTSWRRESVKKGRVWFLPEAWICKSLKCQAIVHCHCDVVCMVCSCITCWSVQSQECLVSHRQPGTLNVLECLILALMTSLLSFPFSRLLRALNTEAVHALFETCPNARPHHFGLCDQEGNMPNTSFPANVGLLVASAVRFIQLLYVF